MDEKPAGDRATRARKSPVSRMEHAARLEAVREKRIERGWSMHHLETHFGPKWDVKPRQVRKYIAKVDAAFKAARAAASAIPDHEGDERARYEETIAAGLDRAIENGNHHAAARFVEMRGKLRGYFVDRAELTGANGAPLNTSPADAVAELIKEIERRAARNTGDGAIDKPE